MNITDVGHLSSDADTGEDKMLKGAKREHKTVMEIAQFYTDAFFQDCAKLNIKPPTPSSPPPAASTSISRSSPGLMDTGYAYFAGGNVYFDTSQAGPLLRLQRPRRGGPGRGRPGGRGRGPEQAQQKRLRAWFTKSKFEDQALKWDTPWGVGYPGWHIECSCISMPYNGEYLDLHCGGIDNAFPHHTNEIAQSEAYLGHPWCKHWFHVHHLNTTQRQDEQIQRASF